MPSIDEVSTSICRVTLLGPGKESPYSRVRHFKRNKGDHCDEQGRPASKPTPLSRQQATSCNGSRDIQGGSQCLICLRPSQNGRLSDLFANEVDKKVVVARVRAGWQIEKRQVKAGMMQDLLL